MVDFYAMTLETADAIFAEARAFLDASAPPSAERWQQILALDYHGRQLLHTGGAKEQQKFIERVRPYIVDKLDHRWPEHLRVLRFDDDPEGDEGYWSLGCVLEIEHVPKQELGYYVPNDFFCGDHFAAYSGIILEQISEEDVIDFLDHITEAHFKDITSLKISFAMYSFEDEHRDNFDAEAIARTLFERWAHSLENLQLTGPEYYNQTTFRRTMLEQLSASLPTMTSLEKLEWELLFPDRREDFALLIEAIGASNIKKLGLQGLLDETHEQLLEMLTREPELFANLDELLLDQLSPQTHAAFLRCEALSHLEARRFFKETAAASWWDEDHALMNDLALASERDGALSKETLDLTSITIDMLEGYDLPMLSTLLEDANGPRCFAKLETFRSRYFDTPASEVFIRLAPRAFPNLAHLDFEPLNAVTLPEERASWPNLKSLFYRSEDLPLEKFIGPGSLPSLETLEIVGGGKASWIVLFEHPEFFPSLKHLSVCTSVGRNQWYAFLKALRSSPLLKQLHTIKPEFGSPHFYIKEIPSWVEDALDETIPLSLRRYIYAHLVELNMNQARLVKLLEALGEASRKRASAAALSKQFFARFPDELDDEYDPDAPFDVRDLERF